MSNRAAIIDGVQTPIGTLGGALKDLPARPLGAAVTREVLRRARVPADQVEQVIFGCCGQSSDAPNVARVVALDAGVPKHVPAYTVMQNCASGITALASACQAIAAGDADVQIVGGVESMSSMPFVSRDLRFGQKLRNSALVDSIWEGLTDPVCNQVMGRTAENLVDEFKIMREEQDAYAVESHRRAFRATREGRLKEEMVAISVEKKAAGRAVAPEIVSQDEGVNPALNLQVLSLYPTIFKENGTVTPGNSCGISDAAGAMLVMSEERAKSHGLSPLGYVRAHAFAGLEPERMGLGPVLASQIALKKTKLTLKDMQLIELNEAFAAQVIACERLMKFDRAIVNANGGAIALGHPVGFTGVRIVLTLLKEMKRRNLNLGLATLCVGGGQGAAVILER